jgi:hypothetical protein
MTVDDPVPVCANTGKLAIPISITAATAAHPAAPDNSLLPNFTPQTTGFSPLQITTQYLLNQFYQFLF